MKTAPRGPAKDPIAGLISVDVQWHGGFSFKEGIAALKLSTPSKTLLDHAGEQSFLQHLVWGGLKVAILHPSSTLNNIIGKEEALARQGVVWHCCHPATILAGLRYRTLASFLLQYQRAEILWVQVSPLLQGNLPQAQASAMCSAGVCFPACTGMQSSLCQQWHAAA